MGSEMTILSVCNLKGGSGKTTVAVHLACALKQLAEWNCVLADADRQATATAWSEQGRLPITVVRQELQEARPSERFPGMTWITSIKMAEEQSGHAAHGSLQRGSLTA